ncbi:MAG: T9SS type A sorting domain-containing protein [Saprospiraceae bacterium]
MKNNLLLLLCFVAFVGSLSAQWTKTKGLPGGSFEHFVQIADTTFAQHHAGIYFSTDGGFTWKNLLTYDFYWSGRLTTDGHNLLVRRYVVDPLQRLIRSNDAGQSWISIPVPDTLSISFEVIVGPWVVIGTPDGAFRTGDNGASWEFIHDYLGNLVFDGQRIFGWDANSLLASEDFGQSWQPLTSISKASYILAKDSVIMVFHYGQPNKITVSKDNGMTWEAFSPNLSSNMYNAAWHEGEVYGFRGSSIWKTNDFGETWQETTTPNLYVIYNGISVGNGLLVGGDANGIFRSDNGGDSWAAVNEGLIAQSPPQLRSVGQNLFAPGREGIYHLAPDQENWELQHVDIQLPPSFFSFLDYAELNGNQIVAINGKPWFSNDSGTTWSESTFDNFGSYQIGRLETAGGNVIGWGEINFDYYVSSDKGQSFQYMNALQTQYNTYCLQMDYDNGTLYAVTGHKHLCKSSDGGDHWEVIGSTIPIELFGSPQWFGGGMLFVRDNSVFIFSNDSDSQFGTKVLFSNDLGETWQLFDNLTTGFPWGEGIFNDLVESGGYLIAATKAGISYSSDGGSTWTPWNEGFQNRVASRLCVHEGQLWSSMTSDGVWKRSLSELAPLSAVQPQSTTSLKIFPNPTSDYFLVETDGESGWLSVWEILGKTVYVAKTNGQHLEIPCQKWPAGIYQVSFVGEATSRETRVLIQK